MGARPPAAARPAFTEHSCPSQVVGLSCSPFRRGPGGALSPFPATDLRHIVTIMVDVLAMLDQLVIDRLNRISCSFAQLRHARDHILDKIEAVNLIEDAHIEGDRKSVV